MSASIHHISSDFDTISTANLSPAQAQVIAVLVQGRSVTAAALEAGIHRSTIHNWLRHEPAFKTAMQNAHTEYTAALNDSMRDLAALALETLRTLLDDPQTPPAIRLKAALAILQRPHFPKEGWHLPESIEGLAAMETDVRARMPDAPTASAPQTERKDSPQVARNAWCPCGSDKKYKRCCGSASPGKWTSPANAAAA
jgi:hypothetical protein